MATIELFGLPGAGKTSILDELTNRAVDGWEATPKMSAGRFSMRHPLRFARAARATLATGSLTYSVARLALFRERQLAATRHDTYGTLVVFHEGILTAARRMQTCTRPPLSESVIAALVPATDIVIVVDTPEEIAFQRFLSRLERTGDDDPILPLLRRPGEAEARWQNIRHATEIVVAALPRETPRIDGTRAVEESAADVLRIGLSLHTSGR
jgi:thymidylate kinase